jgi:hypothetical protein
MPFHHPCFISYVHGEHELIKGFLTQLKKALDSYLEPYFEKGPYIDDEGLSPGNRFNDKLAEAICRSVCMIVVYVPKYDQHTYCLREYRAMEILEEKRLGLLGAQAVRGCGLIIPIILRGRKDDLPEKIRDHIHFCDFSKFSTASPDISSNPEYVGKIDDIAYYIFEQYKKFEAAGIDICTDCHTFQMPDEQQIKPWREKTTRPPIPFVLREEGR